MAGSLRSLQEDKMAELNDFKVGDKVHFSKDYTIWDGVVVAVIQPDPSGPGMVRVEWKEQRDFGATSLRKA